MEKDGRLEFNSEGRLMGVDNQLLELKEPIQINKPELRVVGG